MPSPPDLLLVESLLPSETSRALALLLELWRVCPHPDLTQLIERLGERTIQRVPEPAATQRETAARIARRAAASTAGDRASVIAEMEAFANEAKGIFVAEALEALEGLEPDPRIALLALRIMAAPHVDETLRLSHCLRQCLLRHGDAYVVATARATNLTRRKAFLPAWYTVHLSETLQQLEKTRPAVPVPQPEVLARLIKQCDDAPALLPQKRPLAELLEAIVAAPDDDGPRLVYADALNELGDPQGEFIILQVARARGDGTKEMKQRETELLQQHRKRFLGELEKRVALTGLRFERGFLAACSLKAVPPDGPATRLLMHVDSWYSSRHRFDNLRSVSGIRASELLSLLEQAPRLTDVGFYELERFSKLLPALRECPRKLRSISIIDPSNPDGPPLSTVYETAVGGQLEELILDSGPHAFHLPAQALADLVTHAPSSLRRLVVRQFNLELTLSRNGERWDRFGAQLGRWSAVGDLSRELSAPVSAMLKIFVDAPLDEARFARTARSAAALGAWLQTIGPFARNMKFVDVKE